MAVQGLGIRITQGRQLFYGTSEPDLSIVSHSSSLFHTQFNHTILFYQFNILIDCFHTCSPLAHPLGLHSEYLHSSSFTWTFINSLYSFINSAHRLYGSTCTRWGGPLSPLGANQAPRSAALTPGHSCRPGKGYILVCESLSKFLKLMDENRSLTF